MQIGASAHPLSPASTDQAATRVESVFGPRPAVTVYRPGGERLEMSGAVLANWAFKTANLLTEELEVQAGESLALDCAWGWRPLSLALGGWACGLELVDPESASGPFHLASDSRSALTRRLETADAFSWILAVPGEDLAQTWSDEEGRSLAASVGRSESLCDYGALAPGFGDSFHPFTPVTGPALRATAECTGVDLPPAGSRDAQLVQTEGTATVMTRAEILSCAVHLTEGRRLVIVTDPDADLGQIRSQEHLA